MSVLLPEAIEQMKHHEGVRQKPYLCPAHIWTVGVGRVLYHDQIKLPMVRKGEYTGQIRREYPIRLEDSRLWSMEEVDELRNFWLNLLFSTEYMGVILRE